MIPENAMQWLQTLPQDPDRTKALQTIHKNMPEGSPEAQTFASQYGLGK